LVAPGATFRVLMLLTAFFHGDDDVRKVKEVLEVVTIPSIRQNVLNNTSLKYTFVSKKIIEAVPDVT
jgi:hypothetical protein